MPIEFMLTEPRRPAALVRQPAAETLGTASLVLGMRHRGPRLACRRSRRFRMSGTALAVGLMAYVIGPISGGQFNSAMTIELSIAGRFAPSGLV